MMSDVIFLVTFLAILILTGYIIGIVAYKVVPTIGQFLLQHSDGNAILVKLGNWYLYSFPYQFILIIDKGIFYIFIVCIFSVLYAAFKIRSNPIFLIVSIVGMFITYLVSVVIYKTMTYMQLCPFISTVASMFFISNAIVNNIVYLSLGLCILVLVALYITNTKTISV